MNEVAAILDEPAADRERQWLAAARAGDAESFRRIVEFWRDRVFTFLLRMVKQHEEAEDLAQETFVRAWRHLADYDDRWAFRTWLFSIARNLALNALRRPRAMILSIDGEEGEGWGATLAATGASPSEEAAAREQKRRLAQALETLPPRSAMIFTLFYQEEMPIAEIAQAVGMSPGAVRVTLHRVRETLRERLK